SPYTVPLTDVTTLNPLVMQDGQHKVGFVVQGLLFGSPEYWDVISSRKKMAYAKASQYTQVGNELRQTGSNPDLIPVVYTNLPHGLGRYEFGGMEKTFYLKNHLGSTIVGAPSNSALGYDVYDYFAYGKEVKEVNTKVGDQKLTETFTGKELDEKIGLDYFGARYYDADLAVWISPDPARFFHSPYSYSGNGYNPINSTDPDGRNPVVIAGVVIATAARNPTVQQFAASIGPRINQLGAAGMVAYKNQYQPAVVKVATGLLFVGGFFKNEIASGLKSLFGEATANTYNDVYNAITFDGTAGSYSPGPDDFGELSRVGIDYLHLEVKGYLNRPMAEIMEERQHLQEKYGDWSP
ncbi:MAG: RHS repeat-associated core domain-containing protein, partial [Fibrobacterota bacterium]|nr:RHS repeat-associated core domain-containing protein [Fibrobacterota bacterium]